MWLEYSLIYWYYCKQNSLEYSSLRSEFISMKQCCEYLRGLKYKFRTMGIPCVVPEYNPGKNQSVRANKSIPDSTLKKKNQSIAYHFIREGAASDEWRTLYVNTHNNEAYLLKKLPSSGDRMKGFIPRLMRHIFGYCCRLSGCG